MINTTNMKKTTLVIIGIGLISWSCKTAEKEHKQQAVADSVYVDEYYTSLFDREEEGFTGGDGTYSVELPDGSTAWIFGDTFLGGVNKDGSRTRQVPMYIRNSVVIQEGDSLKTLHSMLDGLEASFVVHPSVLNEEGELTPDSVWFWPGDAYIENGDMYFFLSEFIQADTGMWGFQWEETWLAVYDLPEMEQKEIIRLPQGKESGVHLGHAVYPEDEYIYVYGAKGGKPHVARYPAGNFRAKWEYFNGSEWSDEPEDIKPMTDYSGSEQFSVFEYGDLYVMVSQAGNLSDEIYSFTADTPYGPWENKTMLYKTPIPDTTKNLFTYNAVAHPHLIENGELLISYNMNSKELADHFKNADIYRPRFIRVPLGIIDSRFEK